MRWVKRGLWLAAWGAWGWLGVGLHRELPRDLGPPIAKLHIDKQTMVLGFVGDTNTFALQTGDWPPTLQLLDGESGRELGKRPLPFMKCAFMNANQAAFQCAVCHQVEQRRRHDCRGTSSI